MKSNRHPQSLVALLCVAVLLPVPRAAAYVCPESGGCGHADFECETCPCPPGGHNAGGAGGGNGGGGPGGGGGGWGPRSGSGGLQVSVDSGGVKVGCSFCAPSPTGGASGMPRWRISEPQVTLWIDDTPLGYQPAYGPGVEFKISYNHRSPLGLDESVFGAGRNWNNAWLTYVVPDDPLGSTDDLYLPGGGARAMNVNCVAPPCPVDYRTQKKLSRPAQAWQPYYLDYPDGTRDTYGFYLTNSGGDVLKVFLSQRTDPHGKSLTFTYASYNPAAPFARLLSVTDAEGRSTTLYYATNHPWATNLITAVVDPFGRTTTLTYDDDGLLTNIVDVAGLSTSFAYDLNNFTMTNMVTPYGLTSFELSGGAATSGTYARVTEPNGGVHLVLYQDDAAGVPASYSDEPSTSPFANTFDNSEMNLRNTFYWGPLQCADLSTTTIASFTTNDFRLARLRHWLAADAGGVAAKTLSLERRPGTGGTNEGQKVWYDYAGKPADNQIGTTIMPLFEALVLPEGETRFTRTTRNDWNLPVTEISTYTTPAGSVGLRTNLYYYAANNQDLAQLVGPQGEQVVSNYFNNSYHQPDASYDALNQEMKFTYNANRQLTSIKTPAGLTTTNYYYASGSYAGWLEQTVDIEIGRTNSYTYADGLVQSHTDERSLTVTNFWDALQRLTGVRYPDGTTASNRYTALDLTAHKDRLGNWSYIGYNAIRQRLAETNANGVITRYSLCDCGMVLSVTNAWNTPVEFVTTFEYDNQGNRYRIILPDASITNWHDSLSRPLTECDAYGCHWLGYNNQGLRTSVTNAYGVEQRTVYDIEDRPIWVTDANGVTITNTYDELGRLRTRTYPDGGVEAFGYSARGLIAYTNQLGMTNYFVYDEAGRKLFETNANWEVIRYTNNAAGDLLALVDGKNQVTKWNYDEYGRVTNKLDQLGTVILKYTYDVESRLSNRWSVAKGTTIYSYDAVGNLTTINYPASTDVTFAYDALNRATNMVDAAGTTAYRYAAGGQLWTEDGPWSSDTVTNYYANRLRTNLSLAQPTGKWTNGFVWDAAKRLTNVTSQAGAFGYTLGGASGGADLVSPLLTKLTLANTSYITNAYDNVARLRFTKLNNSSHSTLDAADYGYDAAHQRVNFTNAANTWVTNRYDKIGQLTVADSTVNTEDRGYTYDMAWNLNYRTNNGAVTNFIVDGLNQLTNGPLSVNYYDANGNLTNQAADLPGSAVRYTYDDENRLVDIYNAVQALETIFIYDGLGRLRIRQEYEGAPERPGGEAPEEGMTLVSETRYVYDGWRVMQERDANNTPTVSYTRGTDLSGSLEGAGGIGGLLARSHGYSSGTGNWSTHNFYHADGNGNITYLVNSGQTLAASYRYDPFGNLISSSGGLANANVYRFSSKECHVWSGLYYYGFRFYCPSTHRWPNQDPIGEPGFEALRRRTTIALAGGPNRYLFVRNNPNGLIDSDGLDVIVLPLPPISIPAPPPAILIGGAFCAGAAVGTVLDQCTPIGKIGPAIGDLICPRTKPFRETCFLANEVEGYCIYNCPSGPRVFPRPATGCPIRFTFKFPNPLNPTWRP